MEKSRILIIEDNPDTRRFLETILSRDFHVTSIDSAVTGIEKAKAEPQPDLILMDIGLPVLNGFDACATLKKDDKTRNIPIIFLSARNTASDISQGLDLGAEDYLGKPFDYKELIARIRARLREKAAWKAEPKTLHSGDIKLVLDTRDVFWGNKAIELTQTEFDILKLLLERAGNLVTREEILRGVWKDAKQDTQKRTIDVHIRALRKKIPALKRNIQSIYGKGYKFER
ncbi:MAG: response regulator transcription factor [Deltaproteobacteria bacterium]|nr:response regulator transcription factor [Deltaproteobacteria bacterium]